MGDLAERVYLVIGKTFHQVLEKTGALLSVAHRWGSCGPIALSPAFRLQHVDYGSFHLSELRILEWELASIGNCETLVQF